VPVVYCEGSYNTRFDYLKDVPKGKVIYDFPKLFAISNCFLFFN
jgi:hypothetical protein